jgi:hypothetical protein
VGRACDRFAPSESARALAHFKTQARVLIFFEFVNRTYSPYFFWRIATQETHAPFRSDRNSEQMATQAGACERFAGFGSLGAMSHSTHLKTPALTALLALAATATLHAGAPVVDTTATAPDTRYGLFGMLDHHSSYGQGVYPEPFLVDDSDLEVNEARLDWQHSKAGASGTDILHPEIEHGFGLVTVEIEAPYEWDRLPGGAVVQGLDNVDLGARFPVYQYVSKDGFFDTTFGIGAEVGIPTQSTLSKNTEFVPKIFNDLRIGSRITLQSIVGYSMLYGPGEDGGLDTFEYGFVFGFTFQHKDIPIPGVDQIIPVFELSGEKQLNHDVESSVIGNAAIRVNLKAIGRIQPRLGFGYFFPMNQGARQDVHSGIITSLVFEF